MTTSTRVEDADIASLLERVTAATGPDRVLDLDLARALVPDVVVLRRNDDDTANEPHTYWEYTASIDAALALAKRMKPGHQVNIYDYGVSFAAASIGASSRERFEAATPALAIIVALLKALIQEHKDGTP